MKIQLREATIIEQNNRPVRNSAQNTGAPRSTQASGAARQRRAAPKKKRNIFARIGIGFMKFIAVCLSLGIIGGSVVAVMLSMYVVSATANDDALLDLTDLKLAYTGIVYYRDINENGEEEWREYQRLDSPVENRIWVTLDEISDTLENAFIAIEDSTFRTHSGFNLKRTVYAALNEVAYAVTGRYLRDNKQGASTINQQLIKNITDEDADTGTAGYLRKIREIFRAIALTNRYSKDEILEAYLNTIGLTGNIGGVEVGANRYFGKFASDEKNKAAGQEPLTIAECASIAAITKNPTAYSPLTNPEDHIKRRNDVIWYMHNQGLITTAEAEAAYDEPLVLVEKIVEEGAARQSNNSYFTDHLIDELKADYMEQYGVDEATALNEIFSGGWRVYATVVPSLQEKTEQVFAEATLFPEYPIENWVPRDKNKNVILNPDGSEPEPKTITTNSASAIITYKGELAAVAGSLHPKTADRTLNIAVDSPRQVGSTMKGVAAYPLAIETDWATFSSAQIDAPYMDAVYGDDGKVLKGWPSNYSQSYTQAPMTVWRAITESVNTVAVRYGAMVGTTEMLDFCRNTLEITSLTDTDNSLAPLALGSMTHGITPYELAGAYMMNGNGGEFYSLHSYSTVENSKGDIIMKPDVNQVQAISPDTAYIMNRLLRAVVTGPYGTAKGFGIDEIAGMETAGKTGTTNETKDVWFVGMNPYYVMATWFGYNENESMTGRYKHSQHPGIRSFKEIMTAELANEVKYPWKEFPVPEEGVIVKAAFCTESGYLAGGGCPRQTGYYKKDNVPGTCTLHG